MGDKFRPGLTSTLPGLLFKLLDVIWCCIKHLKQNYIFNCKAELYKKETDKRSVFTLTITA